MLFSTILDYLKAPVLLEQSSPRIYINLRKVWSIYWLNITIALISFLLLTSIDHFLVKTFQVQSIISNLTNNNKAIEDAFGPHVTILIVPFFEELAYRLGLSCRREDFSFSTALLFYITAGGTIAGLGLREAILAAISILLFFALYRYTSETFLVRLRTSYFKYYFYLLVLSFGLGHIEKFRPYHLDLIYLYPLFAFPFVMMGISIGYIRVKCGFFYGLLLHSMFNTLLILRSL